MDLSNNELNNGCLIFNIFRIESIGPIEIHEKTNGLQMIQISLLDNDGFKLKFLLWGEQVILANLLR